MANFESSEKAGIAADPRTGMAAFYFALQKATAAAHPAAADQKIGAYGSIQDSVPSAKMLD